MSVKRILVLGAGLPASGARLAGPQTRRARVWPDAVAVTLVNRDAFHNIRVRNYEADLTRVRVPLDDVLGPVGVQRVEGEVTGIDLAGQAVAVTTASGNSPFPMIGSSSPWQPAPPPERRRPGGVCLRRGHLQRRGPTQQPSAVFPADPNPRASLRSSSWAPA